jgi:type I restriction enzyme S subunit
MSKVRPGYRQTEVGIIPEDWEVEPVGALIGLLDAGVSVRSVPGDFAAIAHDEMVLKTSCISKGRFTPSEAKPILPADLPRAKTPAKRNTMLISRMNTPNLVGEVGFVEGDYPKLFLPDRLWMAAPAAGRKVNMRWLTSLLAHSSAGKALRDTATGTSGSMKNISKPGLRGVLVPSPKPEEQQAIAEALGNADALIEGLETLIAKKRDIKQGAMQELLTGHRRLVGFGSRWKPIKIGDIYAFKNGLNKSKTYFGQGTPIVNYMDVYRSSGLRRVSLAGLVTVNADEMQSYSAQKGDVFFTRTSETQDEIGIASVLIEDVESCVFSGFLLRARPKSDLVDSNFAMYCFSSHDVRQQIISRSSYTTRALTNGRSLALIELRLPPTDEQRAIAAVLSDMDAEIAALEDKLAKARAVKQGMMQVLLTGEIRLI